MNNNHRREQRRDGGVIRVRIRSTRTGAATQIYVSASPLNTTADLTSYLLLAAVSAAAASLDPKGPDVRLLTDPETGS